MAECPIDVNNDTFIFDVDQLVSAELEKSGLRNLVNRKFNELNTAVECKVKPKMRKTQDIFDDILKDVDRLEKEQKLLSKELNSLIETEVIVLDDDDDADPEPLRKEVKRDEKSPVQDTKCTIRPAAAAKPEVKERDPKLEPDELGLHVGLRVLAKRRSQWYPASIIDIVTVGDKRKYKVRYDLNRGKSKVAPNHLAIIDTAQRYALGQIGIGSRIAAHFKSDGIYSGIVAEAADRKTNRGRFLVFFDDGYAMYCPVSTVYLVYRPPDNVWEDISYRHTAAYIRDYLSMTERPMVSVKVNQVLKVEFQGEWHKAKCVKVDCSLVEVMYVSDNSREWIFRGSLRLEPLFKQSQTKMKAMHNKPQKKLARAHTGVRKAHIEYATIDLTRDSSPSPSNSPNREYSRKQEMEDKKKNVGKKSTGGIPKQQPYLQGIHQNHERPTSGWKAPWDRSSNQRKFYDMKSSPVTHLPQSFSEFRGRVDVASHLLDKMSMSSRQTNWGRRSSKNGIASRSTSLDELNGSQTMFDNNVKHDMKTEADHRKNSLGQRMSKSYRLPPKKPAMYKNHICSHKCVEEYKVSKTEKFEDTNPLMKPLLLGWTREVSRRHPGNKGPSFHVYYRTPCGRMCRNMDDVDRYMLETKLGDLDYDQFCFDPTVRTHSNIEEHPRDAKFFLKDYSEGKENIPISCVNEINVEKPPVMPYTKSRIPGKGVKIETSKDFMVCCDCKDNCRDRSKCPCQQLTISATSCSKGAKIKPGAGYSYKRLYSFLPTGIYECNPACKCNSNCPNRVVQKGLQCRLQMFKTHKKGWGIRCLDDIAKGTFVCVYTGKIQNEEQANREGLENGDEYLAELDHIEVAERQKDIEDGGSSTGIDSDMDDEDDDDDKRDLDSDRIRRSDDSGNNTTDSELDEEEDRMKDKISGSNGENKRDLSGNHKHRKKWKDSEKAFPDLDAEIAAALHSKLTPPRGNDDDDDDEETTDTDSDYTDYSNNENSRSPSSGPSSKAHDHRTSQGLHSSKLSSDGKLSSDDEDNISQTRRYFGCSDTFIIDAKQTGNLGRYLNHSCSPNLLVQNVFIDTHDLRFPWVAFFATSTIRAGTELTWDYNYEVGSVEGREIQCYCGATKCRKRLL